jgi:replicative DNA helicase
VTAKPSGRVPPHNLQAEESLLGAMLLTPEAAVAGLEAATADAFYKPTYGHVFAAMARVYGRSEPVDVTTVADELSRDGLLEAVGGQVGLASLQAAAGTTTNVARYAKIVTEHNTLRRLIGIAGEIAELGYDMPDDVAATLDAAEGLLFGLANFERRRRAATLREGLSSWLDALEQRFESGELAGVPTGWLDLDELLLGLHGGQLVTVGARPSMGKSALLGNLTASAALAGRPTLFVSLEMTQHELVGRFVTAEAQVDAQRIRRGGLLDSDWARINNSLGRLADLPVHILDDPGATVLTIRSEARRLASAGGLGLIVVDYTQLLDPAKQGRSENRQVEVAENTRGLKKMALDLAVPVVAAAQLSRSCEMRADKRPTLADLRETGELEQSSDVVLFLYRDDYYRPDSTDKGIAEVIVAKQRNGPRGTVKLAWLEQYGRFANIARAAGSLL